MQTLIQPLILQLVSNDLMFTAFDVTMMLRRANPGVNIQHTVVRDEVHQLFSNNALPNYIRHLQTLPNGQQSYVYHPYGTDEEDYDANFLSHSTPQSVSVPNLSGMNTQAVGSNNVMTQAQTMVPTSQVGSLNNKPFRSRYSMDNVPMDKYGRIRVPAAILRESGFKPKDKVRVVVDPNLVVVTAADDIYGKMNGKQYVVDRYNNIRVHLQGRFSAKSFQMELKNKRIHILPV